jgi:8-amino-7-oxononanoate synthase
VTRAAIKKSATDPARRDRLAHLVDYAGRESRRCCGVEPSGSQIIPVIVGADRAAVALAASLQARGFDVRAIRPPTVAEGTARLRIAITLNVDEAMVTQLFEALGAELRQAA